MSTFQPTIPTGTVPLDQDYKNIQLNFQQLDTSFGVDHLPFSNNTPQNGYHSVIHSIPFSTTTSNPPNNQPVLAPSTIGGYGQIFTAQINDGITGQNPDEALYYLSGGNKLIQLTRNMTPILNTNGATFLPGGLILNWGTATIQVSGTLTPITFTVPFPTAVYSIQITPVIPGSSPSTNNVYVSNGTVSLTGFSASSTITSSTRPAYWLAIGT